MNRLMAFAALTIGLLLLPACASFQALPSAGDKDNSPRAVALIVQSDVAPVVRDLADSCQAGILGSGTLDLIADYGPTIRSAIGTYAASARPCVVTDGALVTDRSTGDQCYRGSVQRASSALPSILKDVGLAVGGDLGKQTYLAGIVASSLIGQNDGGVIDGFKKVDDVPLSAFDAAWAPVQADADRLAACAGAS